MFIYAKTFENIRTINWDFPYEDSYYYSDNMAIVADGITRDVVNDLTTVTPKEILELYPRPSGAEIASKTICNEFEKLSTTDISLKEILIKANESVKEVNTKFIKNMDYLVNDYYGAVASSIRLNDNTLEYSYICDCGVVVFDKDGNIKFQTEDDMSKVDKFFDAKDIPWEKPEARVIVRRDYRNKPENKYSYGAITGEEECIKYIKEGKVQLSNGDYIIVYSDGFSEFLKRDDFFQHIRNFNVNQFEEYVENIAKTNYLSYGKEKTIVFYKI